MSSDEIVEKVRVAAGRYAHRPERVRSSYMVGMLVGILASETGADRDEMMLAIQDAWKRPTQS